MYNNYNNNYNRNNNNNYNNRGNFMLQMMRFFAGRRGWDQFGFFLMLDTNKAEYDVDAAIEYDSSNTAAQIAKAVEGLQSKGLSVRAESKIADGLRYRQLYSLKEGKLIIKDDGENNGKAVK